MWAHSPVFAAFLIGRFLVQFLSKFSCAYGLYCTYIYVRYPFFDRTTLLFPKRLRDLFNTYLSLHPVSNVTGGRAQVWHAHWYRLWVSSSTRLRSDVVMARGIGPDRDRAFKFACFRGRLNQLPYSSHPSFSDPLGLSKLNKITSWISTTAMKSKLPQ